MEDSGGLLFINLKFCEQFPFVFVVWYLVSSFVTTNDLLRVLQCLMELCFVLHFSNCLLMISFSKMFTLFIVIFICSSMLRLNCIKWEGLSDGSLRECMISVIFIFANRIFCYYASTKPNHINVDAFYFIYFYFYLVYCAIRLNRAYSCHPYTLTLSVKICQNHQLINVSYDSYNKCSSPFLLTAMDSTSPCSSFEDHISSKLPPRNQRQDFSWRAYKVRPVQLYICKTPHFCCLWFFLLFACDCFIFIFWSHICIFHITQRNGTVARNSPGHHRDPQWLGQATTRIWLKSSWGFVGTQLGPIQALSSPGWATIRTRLKPIKDIVSTSPEFDQNPIKASSRPNQDTVRA